MKLKLNCDLNGHKKGTIIKVNDNNGIPLDSFWRRRLKDAEIDNCVEIVEVSKPKKGVKNANK